MKRALILTGLGASFFLLHAQPSIQWQKCYGGSVGDWAQSIAVTPDSGFIVAGYAQSNDGDVSGNHGADDYWVAKLSSTGTLQWQKCLGGTDVDQPYALESTTDGGCVAAGFTASNDGDVTGNHGVEDFWIVKLDGTGAVQWQKCYGGSGMDDAISIRQTAEGGYITAGWGGSSDGDVTGNHGAFDFWLVKLDSAGSLVWQKSLGGSGDDLASAVAQTYDGGYIVTGSSQSNDGDVTGHHGNWDYWVVKLNDTAAIEWQVSLGGSGEDVGYGVVQTPDSNYVVSGFTRSLDGDVTGLHGGSGQPDYWLAKLSSSGSLLWQKCLGGGSDDKPYSLQNTSDGGLIVAGYAKSNNGDVSGNNSPGIHDEWVVKLAVDGSIEWQKCMGGSGIDWARCIRETDDEGYIVAGFTTSTDGDVTGHIGNNDFWVVKLGVGAGTEDVASAHWQVSPNPASDQLMITGTAGDAVLTLLNPLGQEVAQCPLRGLETQVDVSALAAGIYVVRIEGERTVWTGRVVVE